MGVTSTEQFLAVIEKSGLLEADDLDQARKIVRDHPRPKPAARALVAAGLLSRWQAGQLLAGRSSFLLSKYKLIDLLGRGGMGSVFLAQHCTMNRPVALKVISREIAEDPAALERFLAEARAIATLNHPNIVQAYSVDNEGNRYYIVMEYVDGPDLRQLVRDKGPLDYRRAAEYIRQTAEGLCHAHQQKIIHCDIKPSNLLVNGQGVVKILDMGLARLAGRAHAVGPDQSETVQGSVDYLAPEQARADGELDHRADIYALGCTLYFLLTGRPPFSEGTTPERLMQHQTRQPPELSQLRPDVPAELVAVCRKMMAKQPADRYQSAQEVIDALAQWRLPPRPSRRVKPLDAAASAPGPSRPPKRAATNGQPADNGRPASWNVPESDTEAPASAQSPAKPTAAQTKDDKDQEAKGRQPSDAETLSAAEVFASLAASAAAGKQKPAKAPASTKPEQSTGKAATADGTAGKRAAQRGTGEGTATQIDTKSKTGVQPKTPTGGRPLLGTRERKTLLASLGILGAGGLAALVVVLVMRPWAAPSSESQETPDAGALAAAYGPSGSAGSGSEPFVEEDFGGISPGQIPGVTIPESTEPPAESSGQPGEENFPEAGTTSAETSPAAGEQPPETSEPEPPESPTPEPPTPEPPTPEPSGPAEPAPVQTPPESEPGSEEPPAGRPGGETLPPEPGGETEPEPPAPEPSSPPKPEPPPARPDPFKGLLAAVELPVLSAAAEEQTPALLGRVEVGQEEPLKLELVGGDGAIKGPLGFELQAEPSRANSWLVRLGAPGRAAEPEQASDVARVWLDAGELKLAWIEMADSQARALCNCGLSISARGKTHWLPLSQTRAAEPVVLDLDYGVARRQVTLESPPDPSALRLQVTGVDGELPKPEFKPGDTIAPKDRSDPQLGVTWLTFTPKDTPPLSLRVSFSLIGKRADIEVAAFYQLPNQQPQPFQARQLVAAINTAMAMKQRLEAAQKGKMPEQQKQALKQQTEVAKTVVEQLTALNTLYQTLNKKGALNYRLFVAAGEQQVELYNTRAAPAGGQEDALSQVGPP